MWWMIIGKKKKKMMLVVGLDENQSEAGHNNSL